MLPFVPKTHTIVDQHSANSSERTTSWSRGIYYGVTPVLEEGFFNIIPDIYVSLINICLICLNKNDGKLASRIFIA